MSSKCNLKCKSTKATDRHGNNFFKNSKGLLHRNNDLPAVEYANGDKSWYRNGRLHRDNDLPAIECANGYKAWYRNDERHRDNDLPSIEYANGDKVWYRNGQLY